MRYVVYISIILAAMLVAKIDALPRGATALPLMQSQSPPRPFPIRTAFFSINNVLLPSPLPRTMVCRTHPQLFHRA
jgi:hypothetical protein